MNAYSDMLLGMLAVDLGFLSADQVDAFFLQRNALAGQDPPPIGEHLAQAGLLNATQVQALVGLQQQLEQNDPDIIFGRMLVAQRMVTVAQVAQALRYQKTLPERRPLGEVLQANGLITEAQARSVLTITQTLAGAAPAPAPAAPTPAAPTPPALEPEESGAIAAAFGAVEIAAADATAPPLDASYAEEDEYIEDVSSIGARSFEELMLATLAIDQGFCSPGDLRIALAECSPAAPLAAKLVTSGLITPAQLDALTKLRSNLEGDEDLLFSKLAVEQGVATVEDIEVAFTDQKASDELLPVGELLVDAGVLSKEQYQTIQEQVNKELGSEEAPAISFDDMLIGTLAVDQGVMTQDQLDHVVGDRDPAEPLWVQLISRGLLTQEKLDKLNRLKARLESTDEDIVFAQVATDAGLVNVPTVENVFKEQKARDEHLSVGELLLEISAVSVKQKREVESVVKRRLEGGTYTPSDSSGSTTSVPAHATPAAAAPAQTPASATKPQGKRFGPYQILGEISRGGMGIIYKAVNAEKERTVALKTLAPHLAINEEFVVRFTREAQALAKLSHPNIVGVHSIGHAGKIHFMEMEFIDGEDIRTMCDRLGPLSVPKTVQLLLPVVGALDHAWGRGIIHRDVKPENVMLTSDGVPKLADFGIAKLVESESHTRTGDFFGSPYYTAPEQLKHAKSIDFRADIYSLGACMYRMLCGEPPFGGDSAFQVIARVLHEPIPKRTELSVELGRETYSVLDTLLAKEPRDRPRSGEELANLLRGLMRDVDCAKCQQPFKAFEVNCPHCGATHKPPKGPTGGGGAGAARRGGAGAGQRSTGGAVRRAGRGARRRRRRR